MKAYFYEVRDIRDDNLVTFGACAGMTTAIKEVKLAGLKDEQIYQTGDERNALQAFGVGQVDGAAVRFKILRLEVK